MRLSTNKRKEIRRFPDFRMLVSHGFKSIMILLLLLTAVNCKKKETEGELTYPLETAKLVSQVTSGVISPRSSIQVRFVSRVIPKNLLGQSIKKQVFKFDPSIKGVTIWMDQQTLKFIPNEPLPLRTHYKGILNLRALFPKHKNEQKLEPLRFEFEVAGREVTGVTHDFQLVTPGDPSRFQVIGTISFSEPTDIEQLKKAASLKMNRRAISLEWAGDAESRKFSFTSKPIRRGEKTLKFVFRVKKEPLQLSGDLEKSFEITPLSEMAVVDVKSVEQGDHPSVEVTFSDELDSRQDLSGLIFVTPALKVELKATGRKVELRGDFEYGKSYTVTVSKGVRSRWGIATKQEFTKTLEFEDLKPEIKFASTGVFLPRANRRTIRLLTLNVRKVRVEIKKVFENNLGQFLQTERLSNATGYYDSFDDSYVNRVGVVVFSDSLEVGEERNVWKQIELDLKHLITRQDKGLYLIKVSFLKRDMLYGNISSGTKRSHYYYGEDYYSNPLSPGYLYQHGEIYKPVIVSDIGLTYKQGHNRHLVFATDINNASPLPGVKISLRTYQNQVIASRTTDSRGFAEFSDVSGEVFYIEGEKGGQRSVIKLNEMGWNLSTFATDGVEEVPKGVRAYLYTERGVYRPGDPVNISVIVRNEEQSFPEHHPVTLRIFNPRRQKVYEQTNREGVDGFYHFQFQGSPEDPTGNWRMEVEAGPATFHQTLKIETVVPYRLKVMLEPDKPALGPEDHRLSLTLRSTYLFGTPAANLDARVDVILRSKVKRFAAFKQFFFGNEQKQFEPVEKTIFNGKLNSNGEARVDWQLPSFESVPSALSAVINARVIEKGGRANLNSLTVPIEPFRFYVGLSKQHIKYNYVRTGAETPIPVMVVNAAGQPQAGRTLTYRIYKGARHWWWEFDTRREYLLRFKSHTSTELLTEGTLVSQTQPVNLKFTPNERGIYLVEVQDGSNGHTAGIFVNAYAWGDVPSSGEKADILALKSDKPRYHIGETAKVSFPVPKSGAILLSLERGKTLLSTRWLEPHGDEEMVVDIPITGEMVPTTYVAVSIIQPHAQTANDRPIRMYGVIPLAVEDPETRQELRINMPDELKSNQPFKVEIQTADHQPTQLTVAVVDEGLLALTGFQTPDARKYFYRKLRLGVHTYDLFSQVIGANKGDVFRTFSIGGGMDEEAYRKSQLTGGKKRRFKPVSMFQGPVQTDSDGKAVLEFTMPNYVGAVRVMAVSATGKRYGSAEKTVPVKTPLMVLPTLPRVIGPQDVFVTPVTVFAMQEGIGAVDVTLKVAGPVSLKDSVTKRIRFDKPGEADVQFRLQADPAIGPAKISITAKSKHFSASYRVDLQVRPSSPRIYDAEEQVVESGAEIVFTIPNRGIPGSNEASLSLRRRPNLNITDRLYWLIRYPYGCIEQTVSAAFPQLYLKTVLSEESPDPELARHIDRNINAAIMRLRRFQLPSGAFTYWPGNREASRWGSSYAGEFMTEAKKLGYHVPDDMYRNWLRYLKGQARSTRDHLMMRVYRNYVLALAGEADVGALNYLKENSLKEMKDTEKWLLAGAYYLAGVKNTAEGILKHTGMKVKKYREFGGTYGSYWRDKAMILNQLVMMDRWGDADPLAAEIAEALSLRRWYSTQTSGYMLLALGKYLRSLQANQQTVPRMKGVITFPDGKKVAFDTDKWSLGYPIESGFGKQLKIRLDKDAGVKRVFATLSWNGVPLVPDVHDEQKNISLKVEWLDEDGMAIDPSKLPQGTTFWGHFRVRRIQSGVPIEEVALLQVLPSGWEIENVRLSGEQRPGWMANWNLHREEYVDIRDDRIIWFFDIRGRQYYDFVVKLNTVTVGEFIMPPTRVEAMYNPEYSATKTWGKATVTPRK